MKIKCQSSVYLCIIVGILLISFSCKKDEKQNDNKKIPVITTTNLRAVTSSSVQVIANITSDGESEVTLRGVCWSINPLPTTADDTTISGKGAGSFVGYVKELSSNTKYYLRPYATNEVGTAYGDVLETTTSPTVSDFDGNIYNTVAIETQVWMIENLKTTHYRNGESIPVITSTNEWQALTTGSYADKKAIGMGRDIYGAYYNWYSIADSRNLCPTGWHVPSESDWGLLLTNLTGGDINTKLIVEGYHEFNETQATNESGFSAYPSGAFDGFSVTSRFNFWTSTPINETSSECVFIYNPGFTLSQPDTRSLEKYVGCAVRCIKD